VVAIFFDGCPFFGAVLVSLATVANLGLVIYFLRVRHTRALLVSDCGFGSCLELKKWKKKPLKNQTYT
jgi:hypothetical protein